MMFQLLRFNVMEPSGNVDTIIQYDLKDGKLHTEHQKIVNKAVAAEWVCACMKKYLLTKLQRFVDHKEILSKVSNQWCLEGEHDEKVRRIGILRYNLDRLREYPLDMICMTIVSMEDLLHSILPLPKHSTYTHSRENIKDLVNTASWYVHACNDKNRV